MERQDQNRRRALGPRSLERSLDRLDRVLEGAVVELHHVLAALPPALEAAGQVDVDDVEAAGAEPEVERGDVDDHLVAGAHLAEQRRVGPGRPPLAVDLDGRAGPRRR